MIICSSHVLGVHPPLFSSRGWDGARRWVSNIARFVDEAPAAKTSVQQVNLVIKAKELGVRVLVDYNDADDLMAE